MPAREVIFDDGTRLIWKDRETLQYEQDGRIAWIWVDHEPGLFRRGRVIRRESLMHWRTSPKHPEEQISAGDKENIVAKVRQYFGAVPVRVDE